MHHNGVDDKAWTAIKVGGFHGAYRVENEHVHVVYDGKEAIVEAHNMISPLANAAAEGLARLKLAELVAAPAGE